MSNHKINDAESVVYVKNEELWVKKMGQKTFENLLPHKEWTAGQSSTHFIAQLIEIGDFSKILTKNK